MQTNEENSAAKRSKISSPTEQIRSEFKKYLSSIKAINIQPKSKFLILEQSDNVKSILKVSNLYENNLFIIRNSKKMMYDQHH